MVFSFSQIKKLVYVYLVRYAEEQQDLALLSISTFQRALKVNSSSQIGEDDQYGEFITFSPLVSLKMNSSLPPNMQKQ